MKRIIWQLIGCCILAASVVLFVGCKKEKPSGNIKLGMMAPMTGSGARFGESERNGVQLAIDQINASGGINGRQIEMALEDTKTEPPTAVTAFTRLSERGDLLAIFGSGASLDVPAYLPLVDRAQTPHLVAVAVLPKITEMGSKWTFRTALNDRIAATKMAQFAVNQLNVKKIALLIEDSAFGETGLFFQQEAERLGVKPLAVERFKRGDLDIKPQLTRIQSLGATHVQFWGYYAEYAIVAKQMRDLNYQARLMGNQAPVNDKTIELGGAALEGAMNICLFVPADPGPEARDFVAKYHAKHGADPDTWAAQAYDSMKLLADAIKRSDGTRQGIRDALAATKDFHGITGTISFNVAGDAEFRNTSVVQVSGGKFVPFVQPKN